MVSDEEYRNMSNKASLYHSGFIGLIAAMAAYAFIRIVGGSDVSNNVTDLERSYNRLTQYHEMIVKNDSMILVLQHLEDSTKYQQKIDSLENVIKEMKK